MVVPHDLPVELRVTAIEILEYGRRLKDPCRGFHKFIDRIISLCETVLQDNRVDLTEERWLRFFKEILTRQKQAVSYLYLAEPDNIKRSALGAAYWKQFGNGLVGELPMDFKQDFKGEPDYGLEYKYQGTTVGDWVNDDRRSYSFSDYLNFCFGNPVPYCDNTERAELEVSVIDGRLYNRVDGRQELLQGSYLYVFSCDHKLYCKKSPPPTQPYGFHHSSFLMGRPVICAGNLEARGGLIDEIDNVSGHYKPSTQCFHLFLKLLVSEFKIKIPESLLMQTGSVASSASSSNVDRLFSTEPFYHDFFVVDVTQFKRGEVTQYYRQYEQKQEQEKEKRRRYFEERRQRIRPPHVFN
ncbi:MAG: hypothetical protein ACO2ZM_06920 [Francisellaceae bacterium]